MVNTDFKSKRNLSDNKSQTLIVMAAIAIFYIISFRGIIFKSGYMYQNWDNSIPPFPLQLQHLADISRYAWWSSFDMGTSGVWSGITRYFDAIIIGR